MAKKAPLYIPVPEYTQAEEDALVSFFTGKPAGVAILFNTTVGSLRNWSGTAFESTVLTLPTPFDLGATTVTTSGVELNFVDGVTSSIQTQINTKPTAVGFAKITVSATEPVGPATGDLWIDTS